MRRIAVDAPGIAYTEEGDLKRRKDIGTRKSPIAACSQRRIESALKSQLRHGGDTEHIFSQATLAAIVLQMSGDDINHEALGRCRGAIRYETIRYNILTRQNRKHTDYQDGT